MIYAEQRMRPAAWLAALLFISAGSAARADEKADAVLARSRAALAKLQSLKAEIWVSAGTTAVAGIVKLKRPNLAWIEGKGLEPERVVSDGKSVLVYLPQKQQCLKMDPGDDGSNIPPLSAQVAAFFRPQRLAPPPGVAATYVGLRQYEGADYDVVEIAYPGAGGATVRYFISTQDFLPHRVVVLSKEAPGVSATDTTLRKIDLNPALPDDAFIWEPPANAHLVVIPSPRELQKQLLAVGKPAPDFHLAPAAGGAELSLSDALKGKKALLLAFWSLDSETSRDALTLVEQACRKWREKGLEAIAVERGGDAGQVAKYAADNHFTFPIATAGAGPAYRMPEAYGVVAVPTLYLVGADGKVLWSFLGFNEQQLAAALASAGIR